MKRITTGKDPYTNEDVVVEYGKVKQEDKEYNPMSKLANTLFDPRYQDLDYYIKITKEATEIEIFSIQAISKGKLCIIAEKYQAVLDVQNL